MADSLHKAIHSMSLEEEVPLTLPNDPRFRVFDENATSLLGCLLNPDCQSMSRMIDYMPTAWRVHGRVRGIALSRERFQFIFQREEDLLTVLKDRPWSYNHWAMVMERWTLNPPPDFLQTMQLWTRIRHIPINFYTSETMWKLAAEVGHMEEVAYDPKISQTKDYIRALVTFNTENPAKASRKLDTGGEIVTIEFEYEKLHKRCFHCLRLPHEKLRCPLLRKNQNRGLAKTGEGGPSLSIQVATPKESDGATFSSPLKESVNESDAESSHSLTVQVVSTPLLATTGFQIGTSMKDPSAGTNNGSNKARCRPPSWKRRQSHTSNNKAPDVNSALLVGTNQSDADHTLETSSKRKPETDLDFPVNKSTKTLTLSVASVEPVGLSGGLAVMWKDSYNVEILSSDKRIIDMKASYGSLSFFLSCVYGDPVVARRKAVWDRLVAIGLLRDEAWILAGDFNELMSGEEKVGGSERSESTFWDFRNMAQNCKLKEIRSSGNVLSWCGKRDTVWVQCRLDRSFGNDE
ncbi:hypothetical protein Bca101_031513 [Brassica carinata]